jgi:hypothetical protein
MLLQVYWFVLCSNKSSMANQPLRQDKQHRLNNNQNSFFLIFTRHDRITMVLLQLWLDVNNVAVSITASSVLWASVVLPIPQLQSNTYR